jgi:hypothetical protein
MKWYNTKVDKLPKDKQQVLISCLGINYVAHYDKRSNCFNITETKKEKKISADEEHLYWTEYTKPRDKK